MSVEFALSGYTTEKYFQISERENVVILKKWLEKELSASAFNDLKRITGCQTQENMIFLLS